MSSSTYAQVGLLGVVSLQTQISAAGTWFPPSVRCEMRWWEDARHGAGLCVDCSAGPGSPVVHCLYSGYSVSMNIQTTVRCVNILHVVFQGPTKINIRVFCSLMSMYCTIVFELYICNCVLRILKISNSGRRLIFGFKLFSHKIVLMVMKFVLLFWSHHIKMNSRMILIGLKIHE